MNTLKYFYTQCVLKNLIKTIKIRNIFNDLKSSDCLAQYLVSKSYSYMHILIMISSDSNNIID